MRVDNIQDHVMHSEWIEVPADTVAMIKAAKARSNKVIAVGTTSVRCLETAAQSGCIPASGEGGKRPSKQELKQEFMKLDRLSLKLRKEGKTDELKEVIRRKHELNAQMREAEEGEPAPKKPEKKPEAKPEPQEQKPEPKEEAKPEPKPAGELKSGDHIPDIKEQGAPKWLTDKAKAKRKALKPRYAKALLDYKAMHYAVINDDLRAGGASKMDQEVLESYQMVQYGLRDTRIEFDEPIKLYRGVAEMSKEDMATFVGQFEEALKTGKEVQLAGITSTSVNPSVAAGFGDVVFEITAKYGSAIDDDMDPEGEMEIAYRHNSRFRVLEIVDDVTVGKGKSQKSLLPKKVIRVELL